MRPLLPIMNLKLLSILAIGTVASAGSVSNFQDYGAACSYLNSKESLPAKVTLRINLERELTVPYLIFYYRDLLNFTSIPTMETYFSDYRGSSRKDLYDNVLEDGEFKLDLLENSKLDKEKIWKGTLRKGGDAPGELTQDITTSGTYCVYIAPLADTAVQLVVKQSHGYLSYFKYMVYTVGKWSLLFAVGLFAYLVHYTIQFKVGPNFENLNSLSLISKAIIFYVLPPYILLWIIGLVSGFLENHVANSNNFFLVLMDFSRVWLNNVLGQILELFVLLFAMGYGVTHCLEDSQKYLKLPKRSRLIAYGLFISNVITFSLFLLAVSLSGERHPSTILDNGIMRRVQFGNDSNVFSFPSSIFPFIWFSTTMVYYFKTKKVLAKFPPVSSIEENAVDRNNQTMTSFRRSILVIFVLPVFVTFMSVGIVIYRIVNSGLDDIQSLVPMNPESPSRQVAFGSVMMALGIELSLKSGVWILGTASLNFFLTVILIFAIWIKTNSGIVLLEKDFDEIAQHVIDDDEDLRL